jgi:hypothetical protein
MIPMICTKDLLYAGRRLKAGAAFDARGESDARVLVAIGKATRAPAPVAAPVTPAPTAVQPRAARGQPAPHPWAPQPAPVVDQVDTASASAADETASADRPKRQYRRRDLTAE